MTPPLLSACASPLARFPTWAAGREAVQELLLREHQVIGNPWSLSQVLQHLAQSIEFSMQGFPQMKGAVLRAIAGHVVFPIFKARGAMSHPLDEPIPGAPDLDAKLAIRLSVQRLLDAMDAFAGFQGTLRPHFAYGDLSKTDYEQAHLMHLANHWSQFQPASAVAGTRPPDPPA